MTRFIGTITLESLRDEAPLEGLQPLSEQLVLIPGDPDAAVRHSRWYWLPEDELRSRLPALEAALKPHWYAHFWAGQDLCVILPGRAFWAKTSDRTSWHEFLAHGEKLRVPQTALQRLQTTVPDFVREALAAESDDNDDLPWGNPYCCEV